MRILHAADLHFGKGHRPEAAEALAALAEELRPDAIVVAGDLTHRARRREYLAAKEFLARLESHTRRVVVAIGNHDVPLYRFWERLFAPYAKFRRYIGDTDAIRDVNKDTPAPARFVALSSVAPYNAIVNGRITEIQLDHAGLGFIFAPRGGRDTLRILVVHHALVDPGDGEAIQPFPGARQLICRAKGWAVDLILAGHVHRSHLGWGQCDPEGYDGDDAVADPFRFMPFVGKGGIPVVIAGTASSTRGRGPERGRNSVNVIELKESEIEAAVYLYSEESGGFERRDSRRYARRPRPGRDGPSEPAKALRALFQG